VGSGGRGGLSFWSTWMFSMLSGSGVVYCQPVFSFILFYFCFNLLVDALGNSERPGLRLAKFEDQK